MPKTIKVFYWKTKHATQPWKYAIAMPGGGPLEEKRERYARPFTAKRGAKRELEAFTQPMATLGGKPNDDTQVLAARYKGKAVRVEFINQKPN